MDAADVRYSVSAFFFSFSFQNISKEFKKPQQKSRRQSSLILSVVTEGRRGHAGGGGLLCILGCLKGEKKKDFKGLKSLNSGH